ncbi:FMN-dependent NADH-azoreductase [Streptomyces maoxianensis]|uniref:FMN dependent NADH:quinone oxidoreductase n=1 Tax=Streptomyces maoxianensis TaxID=1459942 RepID=A0ABV9GFF3_9ACTN
MANLLHIDSSPSLYSVSRKLAGSFREVWGKEQPHATVAYRDLVAAPVPHLDGDGVVTLLNEPETDSQRAAAALHDELVEEILSADALLISAPMHNWTIPSHLKAWLDQSLLMGRTLPYDPSVNPLAGRPATVLLAYGGDYGAGSPDHAMDHCAPYLRTVLEKVLGYQLEIITASYTVTPYTSQDPLELEKAATSLQTAEAEVLERAKSVAAAPARA